MRLSLIHKTVIYTIITIAMSAYAEAQLVVSVSVDSNVCVGDTVYVNVGYRSSNNIVVLNSQGTLSHPGRTFLPDGAKCDGNCDYRTSVTFSGFNDSALIHSAQDIKYVRLNIEHSFIGDIYIALMCPNGQRVSLMNSLNGHNSISPDCGINDIPDNHLHWDRTFPNTPDASFGIPFDESVSGVLCDTTDPNNAPGIGWNYCWSDNTSQEYTYANDDGLIYRRSNAHDRLNPFNNHSYATIDSSDIRNLNQLYHPNEHFNALVGCPINGNWTIIVADGWADDNGYIFDWEIALSDTLLLSGVTLDSARVAGGMVINDSTAAIALPQGHQGDTTITYTVTSYFSNGVMVDTSFSIHYFPTYRYEVRDTLCKGDTILFDGMRFTTNTDLPVHYTSIGGCDSIVELHYRFMPTYRTVDTLYFCRDEQFIYDGIDYGGPADIVSHFTSQYGCDSIVGVRLEMVDSLFHLQLLISDDGVTWSDDTAFHACRPFSLQLRDTTLLERWRQWTFGDGDTLTETITSRNPAPITHFYDTVGSFTLTLKAVSIRGCIDTSVVLTDAVNVYQVPTAAFTWDPPSVNIFQADMQMLNFSQPFDSLAYIWNFDGDSSTLPEPNHQPDRSHQFRNQRDHPVTLTAIWYHPLPGGDTLRCIDTASETITVADVQIQFPNMVTPNGDGQNDQWEVVNLIESGLFARNELWIYNSWGMEIYHARNITDRADFWNPRTTNSPDGTYYYRFAAHSPYGSLRRNGTIEVINAK